MDNETLTRIKLRLQIAHPEAVPHFEKLLRQYQTNKLPHRAAPDLLDLLMYGIEVEGAPDPEFLFESEPPEE